MTHSCSSGAWTIPPFFAPAVEPVAGDWKLTMAEVAVLRQIQSATDAGYRFEPCQDQWAAVDRLRSLGALKEQAHTGYRFAVADAGRNALAAHNATHRRS